MQYRTKTRRSLWRNQSGNVMYLTAGLLAPILATIGAGVDLGQAYMAKSRLQQACDAGVLAGRRNMAEGAWDTDAQNAAKAMFNFNYPTDIYGSRNVTFTPGPKGTAEVTASASATVNTIIMRAFGKQEIALTVNCTAKLEISNADIMFVLDTTGSMNDTNAGDSVSKISALKTEVMAFFDTVANAQQGDAVIRYGVMPYSSNVNVGRLLYTANNSWMSNSLRIPSRIPNYDTVQDPTTTDTQIDYSNYVQTVAATDQGDWISGKNSTTCPETIPNPQYAGTSRINTVSNTNNTTTNAGGDTIVTTVLVENWNTNKFSYVWDSSKNKGERCRLYRGSGTARKTTTTVATTPPPRQVFRDYTYRMIDYDVSGVLNGSGLNVPTGDGGATVTASWNGCILERDTVAFDDAVATIPNGAIDLDIDRAADSEASRWHVALPNITYPRAFGAGNSQSATPNNFTTTDDYDNYAEGNNGSGGWSACPSQAMKLTSIPKANRSVLQNYVNSLVAVGGTYHDVGMVWGTRFLSSTGLFASENATAPNGAPISRHIIFMTDGQMAPNPGIYGFQGQEYLHGRVGSTSTAELTLRHNRRFLAACEAARSRNITVWVVSFGVTLDANMRACASGDKAYQASNKAQLHTQFQAIAQQITRLRLSE